MTLSLPYWRNRRYLTGIDWVMGDLDCVARQITGMGNYSQVVLELDGLLSPQSLQSILDQISKRFPLIHGRPTRDLLNLAPFWKVPRNPPSIPVQNITVESEAEADRRLEEHANTPLDNHSQYIRCLLIHIGPSKSRLGVMFDHILFDAIGAETFLRLIDQTHGGQLDTIAPKIKVTEPAHLNHWLRRFRSGKKINEFLARLSQKAVNALSIPTATPRPKQQIHWVHDSLTVEQSARFLDQATEEISVPIVLPSATARAILALRQAIPKMPLPGTQHLAFTSASARSPGQEWETLFFNQFSFLVFSDESDSPKTPAGLALTLRDQFFQQMKENIADALRDATMLSRICPHWIGAKFMRRMLQGRLCSLYFACLRETGYPDESFMGLPIIDRIHLPPAISPPGLNLCMTYCANRFRLVLSYLAGALDPADAARIMQQFKLLLTV